MQSNWGKKDEMEEIAYEEYTIKKETQKEEKKGKINDTLRI